MSPSSFHSLMLYPATLLKEEFEVLSNGVTVAFVGVSFMVNPGNWHNWIVIFFYKGICNYISFHFRQQHERCLKA